MNIKERYKNFIDYFLVALPEADTELQYHNPYELLVAVILSAQCTDKRVNMITPAFFKRFPDAKSLSQATQNEVFLLIKSCSYPNNKAKNLIGMGKMLYEQFNSTMPSDIELLQQLPGVGRKTANVIAAVIFGLPAMAVDTHVFRVANRIGLTNNAKNPLQTEKQLVAHIPKTLIPKAHHWLILHGRYVCLARKPKCTVCGMQSFCKYYQEKSKQSDVDK
jgi:endonuclease-3